MEKGGASTHRVKGRRTFKLSGATKGIFTFLKRSANNSECFLSILGGSDL